MREKEQSVWVVHTTTTPFADISTSECIHRQSVRPKGILFNMFNDDGLVLCCWRRWSLTSSWVFHFDVIPLNTIFFHFPWSRRSNFIVCSAPVSHRSTSFSVSQRKKEKKWKSLFSSSFTCNVVLVLYQSYNHITSLSALSLTFEQHSNFFTCSYKAQSCSFQICYMCPHMVSNVASAHRALVSGGKKGKDEI